MNIRGYLLALLAALMLLATAQPAAAAESYDNCAGFITSLPASITSQGTWCLKSDLSTAITSGHAIVVNTNNVTIDCNGFKLRGQGAGAATTVEGVFAYARFNITLRHCDIRGFQYGAKLFGAGGGHVVEDNRFANNTNIGIHVENDSVVRRNQVYGTGGSSIADAAIGIDVVGSVDVLDNTISGVTARSASNGDAVGVLTNSSPDASVSGNRIGALQSRGTGVAYGIRNVVSNRVVLRSNDLNAITGVGGIGIYCSNGNAAARDNITHDFGTAISGCADAGGNFDN